MEARQLIDGAPFNPQIAKACGEAFDQAWAVVVLRRANTEISDLRIRLAEAIMTNAEACGADVNALVKAALSVVLPKSEPHPAQPL